MPLDAEDGLPLIEMAIEKEMEERAWQLWVSTYPHVENQVSFDKFISDIKKEKEAKKKPSLTAEEIIAKAERIRQAHQGKGGD